MDLNDLFRVMEINNKIDVRFFSAFRAALYRNDCAKVSSAGVCKSCFLGTKNASF